jgi:AraC-like DNA-binding protein
MQKLIEQESEGADIDKLEANRRRIVALLERSSPGPGVRGSVLDGVKFMRADNSTARVPVLYEPSIVIVARGRKRGYLGGQTYIYDQNNYLVLSVPMPFECETEVSPEGPMLGVSIKVDVSVLGELLMKMNPRQSSADNGALGIFATPLDERLSGAVLRLLECMQSAVEAEILGPQIMREITYLVLCGEQGGALLALIALNGRIGQIQRAVQRMHIQYNQAMDITELAEDLGMSPSAFHHNFKAVTATSPLQYLKTIRLHKAKMFMVQEGIGAGDAAERVGYESVSQFSREFKRFFGESPLQEVAITRARLGLEAPVLTRIE